MRAEKLVINYLLILSFNLVILGFANDKRLLKIMTTIFLKSFFILAGLPIATTTRRIRRIIDDETKIEGNVNYIDILKASRLHAN